MTKDRSRASERTDGAERQDLREVRSEKASSERFAPDNHLLVRPRKTMTEQWAEEDEERHAGETRWGGYPLSWGDEG